MYIKHISAAISVILSTACYAVEVPPCDPANPEVAIIDSASDFTLLNNTSKRIFCVVPGDWTLATNIGNAGIIDLLVAGTATSPKILRYGGTSTDHPAVMPQSSRARIGQLRVKAPYWVIYGMSVYGRLNSTNANVQINGVAHTTIDFSHLEGSGKNTYTLGEGKGDGYLFTTLPNSHYTILTRSVIRNTAMVPYADRICVNVYDSDFVEVSDNEIYDCASNHIQLGSGTVGSGSCEGARVFNNSIYETGDTYCDENGDLTGPTGLYSGSETGIDIKAVTQANVTPPAPQWVRIYGNVIWGLRTTQDICGGTGTVSPAFLAYNHPDVRGIEFHDNVIMDSPVGVKLTNNVTPHYSRDILVHHNLVYDMKTNPRVVGQFLWSDSPSLVSNVSITHNISVSNPSAGTYNGPFVVTDNIFVLTGAPITYHSVIYRNEFYASPEFYTVVPSQDIVSPNPEDSGLSDRCVVIKQWTDPQMRCIPYGG